VAISLAINIRDCHAVARNGENGTFSTSPSTVGRVIQQMAGLLGHISDFCWRIGLKRVNGTQIELHCMIII
jgi:hypothetical protein